jgi:hypothetical protein
LKDPASLSAAALVSALRDTPVNPAAVAALKLRVQSRLSSSLLGLAPAVTAGFPGASLASVLPSRSSGVLRAVTTSKSIILATLAPVFALGVVTGVAGDRWHLRHDASLAARLPPSLPVAARVPSAPSVAQEPVVTAEQLASEPPSKPSAKMPTSTDSASTLAAERSLLDQARQALARGEPGAGLTPLGRHAARFPKGILTEEREALAVRLLAAVGNVNAATSRAEAFHRRFPNSLFTPAVDNAIASISRQNGAIESKP